MFLAWIRQFILTEVVHYNKAWIVRYFSKWYFCLRKDKHHDNCRYHTDFDRLWCFWHLMEKCPDLCTCFTNAWPKLCLYIHERVTTGPIKQYQLCHKHYDDVIMGTIASQITSLTSVYSTVYSDADQSKHQSSASLAFVWGIHRGPVNSPHKWPVTVTGCDSRPRHCSRADIPAWRPQKSHYCISIHVHVTVFLPKQEYANVVPVIN